VARISTGWLVRFVALLVRLTDCGRARVDCGPHEAGAERGHRMISNPELGNVGADLPPGVVPNFSTD
jgi:hypothetical protein